MATNGRSGGFWPAWEENKLFSLLLAILLVYVIVWVFVNIQKTMVEAEHIGVADQLAPTISVNGTGTASEVPDLAKVDLTMVVRAETSSFAQDLSDKGMENLADAMRALGIEETDLKTTGYGVSPVYDYDVSPAAIVGYEARQTLTVTIRDTAKTESVLSAAGDLGVDEIGDVRMEVADESEVLAAAREEAIADAYAQAVAIADAMGATLGDVVSYYEYQGGDYYPYYSRSMMAEDMMGSGEILEGENEYEVSVTINYAIE
ncbi:SIMPL domain-containing protein [Candidatus Uhrbacteria bacterium]|nr:SIMPL domain-containing protein [Candidatus Uhrbacteria bacterium]